MPEIIILDTHIWFWLINQEFQRFPNNWREAIETAEQVGVSVISCYEIALAQQRGRIELYQFKKRMRQIRTLKSL